MSKKGKLHTLSKYDADRINRAAFMPKDEDVNLFFDGSMINNRFGNNNFLTGYNTSAKPFATSDIFSSYGIALPRDKSYNTYYNWDGKFWRERSQEKFNSLFNDHRIFRTQNTSLYDGSALKNITIDPKAVTTPKVTNTTGVTPAGSNMWKPSNETMQGWADNWIERQKEKAYDAGDDDSYNKWIDIQNTPGGTLEAYKSSKNALGISKQANPFSKMNIGQTFGAIASAAPRELFDTLDPVYHLAGGRESAIGNGLSETGVGLFKAGAQSGNGALMLAGAGAKVLGGLWNGAFGAKWNKENIADIENNISNLRNNVIASAHSNDEVMDRWTNTNFGYDFDQNYIGKNGWLNHKATRKYKRLAAAQEAARGYAKHNLVKAAEQADRAGDRRARSRFTYDEGGFLDNILNSDMGSGTKYLLASSDLDIKRQNADTRAKMASMYAGTPGTFFDNGGPITAFNPYCGGGKLFALGGDYQTNGADFSTGLTHIDAGLSHEMNPNEGVQVGVDPEGTPNLVEEGEVIWNDYVFSNRIQMDNEAKEAFHINKKRDITYANEAKRLEKEVKERPNDPISKAAFNAQMEKLQEQQERQKAEMEARRAQEAFAALSPEEQVAVMQQAQAQEQQAQETAMQEQAMAQQQAMQQQPATPEEAAMMQQQMAQPQEQMMQAQPVMAYGGKVNRFDDGGFEKWWAKNTQSLPLNFDHRKFVKAVTGQDVELKRSDVYKYLKDYFENNFNASIYDSVFDWNDYTLKFPEGANAGRLPEGYNSPEDLEGLYSFDNPSIDVRTPELKLQGQTVYGKDGEKTIEPLPYNVPRSIAGSYSKVLHWLKENYIETSDEELEKVAKEIAGIVKVDNKKERSIDWLIKDRGFSEDVANKLADVMITSKQQSSGEWSPKVAFEALVPTVNFNDKNIEKYLVRLMDKTGLDVDTALSVVKTYYRKKSYHRKEDELESIRHDAQFDKRMKETYSNYVPASSVNQSSETPEEVQVVHQDPDINSVLDSLPEESRKIVEDAMAKDIAPEEFNKLSPDRKAAVTRGYVERYAYTPKEATGSASATSSSGYTGGGTGYYGSGNASRPGAFNRDLAFADSLESMYNTTYPFTASNTKGHIPFVRGFSQKDVMDIEADPRFSAWTDYVLNNWNNEDVQSYLRWLNRNATGHALPTDEKGNITEEGKEYFRKARTEDHNMGFYHITPKAWGKATTAETPAETSETGTVTPGEGSTVEGGAGAGAGTGAGKKPEDEVKPKKYEPILQPETNYGMYAPIVNMGMMAAGIGKPDYSEYDKAQRIMNRPTNLATYQPVPGYLTYKPADIWAAQIANNASARASDRAIANADPMAAIAGHVANNYANQIANGDLFAKALTYNDNERKIVGEFNRGTNIQNANAFNALSQFNAGQLNADKQRQAYLAANIAAQKIDADASWYNSLYGNVNKMFENIAAREKEIRDRNYMAKMLASDLIPYVNSNIPIFNGYIRESAGAAEGGKIARKKKSRKKGLTI